MLCQLALPSRFCRRDLLYIGLHNAQLDWERLMLLFERHGVLSIAYENLLQYSNLIPEAVLSKLRLKYLSANMLQLKIFSEVKSLAQVLQDSMVRACFIKGALLSLQIYGKPTVRNFADIDVLICEGDYPAISSLIVDRGYTPARDVFLTLRGFEVVEYAHYCEQIRFVKAGMPNIELHFRLMNMGLPAMNDSYIWAACGEESYKGTRFTRLSLEDALVHLAVHGAQHRFSRFSYFSDIVGFFLMFKSELSELRILDSIKYLGAEKVVDYSREMINTFYPNLNIFQPTHSSGKSVFFEGIFLPKKRVERLESTPFPQMLESSFYFLVFGAGVKVKFTYLKNVFSAFLKKILYCIYTKT